MLYGHTKRYAKVYNLKPQRLRRGHLLFSSLPQTRRRSRRRSRRLVRFSSSAVPSRGSLIADVSLFLFLLPYFFSLFLVATRLIPPGSMQRRLKSTITNLFRAVTARKQPCIVRYEATSRVPSSSEQSAHRSTSGPVRTSRT
ncbi:hypothetical protein GW17_00061473, partial [Ensete ventricosum]